LIEELDFGARERLVRGFGPFSSFMRKLIKITQEDDDPKTIVKAIQALRPFASVGGRKLD
jgi:hypothetical protein